MKNTILFVLALFCAISVTTAQTVPTTEAIEQNIEKRQNGEGPQMVFEKMVVDYGVIEQHSEPLRKLTFVNKGTEPLVITNARGSCGCTVPTYAKEPIMPGESSEIEVRYATNRLGKFSKKVTITTNEGGEPHVINVTGEVYAKEKEEGVPASKGTLGGGK
ncbi:DUF1573 domain-containing protein [Portibacter marinus]|uniref:DUF1573 domain-containing protein n=1 Tax=Portibacter marinus TaxID=2898660 RepID=UPI001F40695E|nr:DUF1573 domain-containing protein [Portibacter marinus]